ncbi:MAG TPA: sigma factor [Sphingobium sp.]|uniref:sigma factor n=1 Tax=Sphingobium sp. TaxID=1912891 RepID=UPI002ED0AC03
MSKVTVALEAAVSSVLENRAAEGQKQTGRQRLETDRAFARILKLIAPRIRHFIRQYGLIDHWEDAEQVCAIAVHRAIDAYDPEKAKFTTFVNWQIRGELQSLRFRVMTDQRPSAKKVAATTISLNLSVSGADGEEAPLEAILEDEEAWALTEAGASEYLAKRATEALMTSYVDHLRTTAVNQLRRRPRPKKRAPAPALKPCEVPSHYQARTYHVDADELEKLEQRLVRNREIVESRLFDMAVPEFAEEESGVTKERARQITKRAARTISELAGREPKFMMMAAYRRSPSVRTRARAADA